MTNANALPLFYTKPVALDKVKHAKVSLASEMGFGFAATVNAVPITIVELPDAMQFYPIAFSSSAPATPLAILGLRANENLFVNDKGQWLEGTYVPAYVRRYPFIFARNDNGDRLTLCIDDTKKVIQDKGNRPFFNEKGEATELTNNALEFCRSYQAAADQTQEFSNALEASGILFDRHAEIRFGDKAMTLTGFRQIDEKKYYEMADATVMEWHKKYWTRFIYAHLLSVGNWQRLYQLMEQRVGHKS
jgi:hypothetical protein